MKIKELLDDEVLDFLMTSEFEDNYSPDELKYLLQKWRYFYRLFNGKFDRYKSDSEFTIESLMDQIKSLNNDRNIFQMKIAEKEDVINSLKNRKLTWKERFTGKIITNEDED